MEEILRQEEQPKGSSRTRRPSAKANKHDPTHAQRAERPVPRRMADPGDEWWSGESRSHSQIWLWKN